MARLTTNSNGDFLSHWYKLDDNLVYRFRKLVIEMFHLYFELPQVKRDLLNDDMQDLFDFYVSLDYGRSFPRKDSKGKYNVAQKRK